MPALNHALVAFVAAAALISTASPQTTYDYAGQPMSGLEYGNPYPYSPPISVCCEALDGTMTFASPLAPNLVNASVTPLAATFSFYGITAGGPLFPGNPTIQFGPSSSTDSVMFANTIDFSTNANGQITAWDVDLSIPANPYNFAYWAVISTSAADTGTYRTSGYNVTEPNTYDVSNDVAGNWAPAPSLAPEISAESASTGLMLLAGLTAILGGRRKSLG